MAREYFCAYHSYLASMRNLSDAECGRLFRALLQYSAGDSSINLQGRESVAFDFMAVQIDRDHEAYQRKCKQNSANRTSTTVNGRQRPSTKRTKDKEKEKENNSPPLPPSLGGSPGLQAVFEDWLAYKQERREAYKPTGLKSLVTQVQNAARQYGEQAVADLIRTSMASNWAGIAFDRLRQMKPPDREEEDPYANAV